MSYDSAEIIADELSEQAQWAVRTQAGDSYPAPGFVKGALDGVVEAAFRGCIRHYNGEYELTKLGREVADVLFERRPATAPADGDKA